MSAQEQTVEVRVGTGGDPLTLGLPVFAVASLALGMGCLGKPSGLAVVAPLIILTTGIFQVITTVWAIIRGQSIVALIFALFSGFWLTLGCVLIGTQHGWFGIPAGGTAGALELIFICYSTLFFFLLIPCLRLPVIYPITVALIVVALAFAAAGALAITGYLALAFSFLGFWASLNVAHAAMGTKAFPPLGKPLLS
ncbi:MAG: GPR1/FUN34/YaaH family transporter [Terriglobia bacterium]